jgi:hypothetical protein
MAIGDTVQAGLMRIDPSAILRAGEAQARVGERIGQTVSGLVGTYVDTKRRRQELEGERKGISESLKMLAKVQPEMRDVYEAQSEMLNDTEIPLSTRVAAGIRSLQNVGMAEKFRSARFADQLAMQNQRLQQEQALTKSVLDNLNISDKQFELARKKALAKVITPEMEARGQIAEIQKKETEASQVVQPVFDASGRPMAGLARRGTTLLRQDPRTGQVSILGTGVENVVDVDETPIATPTIKMVDPERGFRGTAPAQIEDAIQSASRFLGFGTIDELPFFEGSGKEKLTASQRITTIGQTLKPLLMSEFGGKMTDTQLRNIEASIPLVSDDPEEGMAKMAETVNLLRNQLNKANDAIGTLNPKTQAFAEAMSTKKGIEANLPIIEEIVNRYYGNIPTEGIGTMGQSPNVDALLESLPRDTNRSRADLDVTDILSQ